MLDSSRCPECSIYMTFYKGPLCLKCFSEYYQCSEKHCENINIFCKICNSNLDKCSGQIIPYYDYCYKCVEKYNFKKTLFPQ